MTKSPLANARASILVTALAIISCSSQQYNPDYWHQGFVVALQKYVGHDFKEVRTGQVGGWGRDASLKGRRELPSGNIAYKYSHLRTCRYILEVDPKTDIVVGVDWEGDKGDCIIVP